MKIELYLEDPMGGGCGCSSSMKDRMLLVKRIRDEAQIWDKVKKSHTGPGFIRAVLSSKIPVAKYPEYVGQAVDDGLNLPFLFIDGKLVHSGSYPDLGEFNELINNGGDQKA
ncbi:MAG: hypothetical protein V1710_00150 [Candidatus Bathyarchaeota archaeon]